LYKDGKVKKKGYKLFVERFELSEKERVMNRGVCDSLLRMHVEETTRQDDEITEMPLRLKV
jgi:hypothetical protein